MKSLSRITQVAIALAVLCLAAVGTIAFRSATNDSNPRAASSADAENEVAGPVVQAPAPPTVPPSPDVFISATGNDAQDGRTETSAVRSIDRALQLRGSGGVVFFTAGDYPIISIDGVEGTASDPILFTPTPAAAGQVTMSSGTFNSRIGIQIRNSSHIILDGFRVTASQKGIDVERSQHIVIRNNVVESVGQEAIRAHTESSFVEILANTVSDTGRREGYGRGEGIYVGTGAPPQVDLTHDVLVEGNTIFETFSEGVDVKAPTYNVTVRGNRIFDIQTATSGAVVLHLGTANPGRDPNLLVEDNWIYGITTGSPHRDGNGIVVAASATIRNNVIADTEHRGIYVEDDFTSEKPKDVDISNNTLWNVGNDIEVRANSLANVVVIDNIALEIVGDVSATGNEAPHQDDFVDAAELDFRLAADARFSRRDVGAYVLVGDGEEASDDAPPTTQAPAAPQPATPQQNNVPAPTTTLSSGSSTTATAEPIASGQENPFDSSVSAAADDSAQQAATEPNSAPSINEDATDPAAPTQAPPATTSTTGQAGATPSASTPAEPPTDDLNSPELPEQLALDSAMTAISPDAAEPSQPNGAIESALTSEVAAPPGGGQGLVETGGQSSTGFSLFASMLIVASAVTAVAIRSIATGSSDAA